MVDLLSIQTFNKAPFLHLRSYITFYCAHDGLDNPTPTTLAMEDDNNTTAQQQEELIVSFTPEDEILFVESKQKMKLIKKS